MFENLMKYFDNLKKYLDNLKKYVGNIQRILTNIFQIFMCKNYFQIKKIPRIILRLINILNKNNKQNQASGTINLNQYYQQTDQSNHKN